MKVRRMLAQLGLSIIVTLWVAVFVPIAAMAAPYAALVIDARTGQVLHETNADTRLHPASLTKMMTLYIAFQAIEKGEISLEDFVTISRNAASEPPSKLGLKSGQKIRMRYLIRAAAVKSANDAATAIGEAIAGSEANFARRMTQTARALGMSRTTFKNAHGLTSEGHLSTARDMTTLGRHLLYDFPDYYNLFSRRTADAGIREVPNTNRRLLAAYKGADGIKTGYTRAAGFNLVASAQRGNERVIATVFGGRSSASRNAKVAELLDLGFRRAPSSAPIRAPQEPAYVPPSAALIASAATPGGAGKTLRLNGAVKTSLRPRGRPQATPEPTPAPVLVAMQDDIEKALEEAQSAGSLAPVAAPVQTASLVPLIHSNPAVAEVSPRKRPEKLVLASTAAFAETASPAAIVAEPEVVTRVSTSGGRHWGINIGRFASQYKAEHVLLKTALNEIGTLDGALRKVVRRNTGFDANFMGLTRESADLACRRLAARKITCFMIGPN